jgi:lysophospholipase L1-like esterase
MKLKIKKTICCSLKKSSLSIILISIFTINLYSQDKYDDAIKSLNSNNIENVNNANNIDFISNLSKLKNHTFNKNINIIHIGDSHIQGEVFTNTIKDYFGAQFGIAGKGLIFPYQIGKTNGNTNEAFKTNNTWKLYKNTSKIGQLETGLMGYALQTNDTLIHLEYTLKQEDYSFNKITLFTSNPLNKLKFSSNSTEFNEYKIDNTISKVTIDSPTNNFKIEIQSLKDSITKIYGISIENDQKTGIVYNSIGVNGAKYSDFNKSTIFWEQIKHINADLIILSMGTNEAQNNNLDLFYNDLLEVVSKFKDKHPKAAIIITTPPISYYKKIKLNPNVLKISELIKKFCIENNISYWDLHEVQNEIDPVVKWRSNKLLRPDLIHYSAEGYRLQAKLFINSFEKYWTQYSNQN